MPRQSGGGNAMSAAPKTKAAQASFPAALKNTTDKYDATSGRGAAQPEYVHLAIWCPRWSPSYWSCCACCGRQRKIGGFGFFDHQPLRRSITETAYFDFCRACATDMYRCTDEGLLYRAELIQRAMLATQEKSDSRWRDAQNIPACRGAA